MLKYHLFDLKSWTLLLFSKRLKSFYGQFNLPQAYHELTAVADIPEPVMEKI
jgi:hypothetical protein